jgi:glutathione S-transferase
MFLNRLSAGFGDCSPEWADDPAAHEAMKKKVPQSVGACFDLVERKMFRGPWAMGEAYTIADPYLFTIARWMEVDSVDPTAYPRVLDHRDRMAERPAVQRALRSEGLA